MNNNIINVLIALVVLTGCSVSNKTGENNEKKKTVLKFQAGVNHGGIVENTNMNEVTDAGTPVSVDAFSGATKTGVNAGVHIIYPVWRNHLESGIDYMYNKNIFTFNDNLNNYMGKRELGVSQIMVPLTYNFGLLRKNNPDGLLQIKFGYVVQFNFVNVDDKGINLTDYSNNAFSGGITLGLSSAFFHLANGDKLGLYFDMYRGSQIYKDFYNKDDFEMPGSSYFKTGLIYEFSFK